MGAGSINLNFCNTQLGNWDHENDCSIIVLVLARVAHNNYGQHHFVESDKPLFSYHM